MIPKVWQTDGRTDKLRQYILTTSLKFGLETTSMKHIVIAYFAFILNMGMILTGVSVVSISQPFQEYLKCVSWSLVCEWMNSDLTSHQQIGHMDTDLGLKSHPKDRRSSGSISDRCISSAEFYAKWAKSGVPGEKWMIFSLQICFFSKARIPTGDNNHQPKNHLPLSPALNFGILAYHLFNVSQL